MKPTIDAMRAAIAEHRAALAALDGLLDELAAIAEALADRCASGGCIYTCGNGGSAADAQHFCAELVGRYERERPALAAVALSTDTSALTAIGNDYGFERVFARQLEALGRPGDVAIGITTSGNSPNVLRAMDAATARGLVTVALTGRGGQAGAIAAHHVAVDEARTARVQEVHATVLHVICELVEIALEE